MKKLMAVIIVSVLALSVVPLVSASTSGDFVYDVQRDNSAEIIKYTGNDSVPEIPSKIKSHSVTGIAYGAFAGCKDITDITVPDSIMVIGEKAFYGCENLTTVNVPDSVTSIAQQVFGGCPKLTAVNIDENNSKYSSADGVVFSGEKTELVFYPTGKTGSYIIPDSTARIGSGAFKECAGLTAVTIPEGVNNISDNAFENCTALTDLTVPESVTSIGTEAFAACTALQSAVLACHMTALSDGIFKDCTALTSVTIPDSIKNIGSDAFAGCKSLAEITLPEGLTDIGEKAFCGCENLTAVIIPQSVTNIGSAAFGYTDTDKKINGFAVYGVGGSCAYHYAAENGFSFNPNNVPTYAAIGVAAALVAAYVFISVYLRGNLTKPREKD